MNIQMRNMESSVQFCADSKRQKKGPHFRESLDNQDSQIWMTGEEIAGQVGLTGVTVRRYLSYLADAGIVAARMDYATGGRPSMEYMISGE